MAGKMTYNHYNNSTANRLVLLTQDFPYGTQETFLESEILVLSKLVDEIIILPRRVEQNLARPIPENCRIENVHKSNQRYRGFRTLLSNLGLVISILRIEYKETDKKTFFRRNLRKINSSVCQCVHLATVLDAAIPDLRSKKTRLYSYWMNDWALACSILKVQGKIPGFIFRAHGFDLFDERQPGNYMPFRTFNMMHVSWVATVSQVTRDYLQSRTLFPEKVAYSYLGTRDEGMSPLQRSGPFRIVSVANLLPLKGVERIIETLNLIKTEIIWEHFGDGILRQELETLAKNLPKNIQAKFKGAVPNREVLEHYRNNSIDLVVLFSKTEGLPVTLMEAISFGIPVMATNVGGVAELVNESTGTLLPEQFDAKQAAAEIEKYVAKMGEMVSLHHNARQYWQNNFEAGKNYTEFYRRFIE